MKSEIIGLLPPVFWRGLAGSIDTLSARSRRKYLEKRYNGTNSCPEDLPRSVYEKPGHGAYRWADTPGKLGYASAEFTEGPVTKIYMEGLDRQYLREIAKSNPALFLKELTPRAELSASDQAAKLGLDLTLPHHQNLQREFAADVIAMRPDVVAMREAKRCYDERKWAEAIPYAREAIRLKPDLAEAYRYAGSASYNLNQYKEAIPYFDRLIALLPDYNIYFLRGSAKYMLKQYAEAIPDYDQSIRLSPDSADPYFYRGACREGLEQYREAIICYDAAIAKKGGVYPEARERIVRCHAQLEKQEKAARDKAQEQERRQREKQRQKEEQRRVDEATRREREKASAATEIAEALTQELRLLSFDSKQAGCDVSEINRRFAALEPQARLTKNSIFFVARGNFYHDAAVKETNLTRKQALLRSALTDYQQVLVFDPFAEQTPEKIEAIEALLRELTRRPGSSSSLFVGAAKRMVTSPEAASVASLSPEDRARLEELRRRRGPA